MRGAFSFAAPVAHTAWSWWTRPRAVSWGGVVYVGAVGDDGAVYVDEWDTADGYRTRHRISRLQGEQDDHNNPALVLEPGSPPIVFYARHGKEGYVRFRKGTGNFTAGAALGTLGAEQTVTFPGVVTYTIAIVHGTDIYLLCRCAGADRWGLSKSTDWGETWSTAVELFDAPGQVYMAAVLVGDTIRCAMTHHPVNGSQPDQDVYYAEIDLTTGNINAGGSTLGNIDGTNLPIQWDTCEQVARPTAGYGSWAYDVSDGPTPEVVWGSFDPDNLATTSAYHYSVRSGGTWSTEDIVAAGDKFAGSVEPYLGGAQFPVDTDGGVVVVSREASGTWYVEEHTTADDGASWSTSEVASDSDPAVRAWPVEQRDGTAPPFEVAVNWAENFSNWNNFEGNVGGSRT